jgi:predicted membrane channel-forming protein YqfA (hemolysin III family)
MQQLDSDLGHSLTPVFETISFTNDHLHLSMSSIGFYCHKTWQIMYISLISIFGAATIFVVMRPKFRSPQFRWVRSGLFLAMGLSGLFPIVHGIVLYGVSEFMYACG